MTDEVRKLKALVNAIVEELHLKVEQKQCERCYEGVWQDGGECAYCDGAGVIYKIQRQEPS